MILFTHWLLPFRIADAINEVIALPLIQVLGRYRCHIYIASYSLIITVYVVLIIAVKRPYPSRRP